MTAPRRMGTSTSPPRAPGPAWEPPAARPRGDGGINWPGVLLGLALPPALWAALWGLSLISDTTRVSSEVSASMRGGGVMVCHDGRVAYDKETLLARLMLDGRFVCTDWRMRESPSIVR